MITAIRRWLTDLPRWKLTLTRWLTSLPRWKLTLALACAVGLVGWLSLLSSRPDSADNPEPAATAAGASNSVTPHVNASPSRESVRPRSAPETPPPAAAPAATQDAIAALHQGLSSDNSGTRIEALRAARDGAQVQVLPELFAFDVPRDPEVAPTLIAVTAELARQAEPSQRTAAALKLGDWLRSESARDASDARGNVAQLVEALGAIDTPEAAPALIEALRGKRLPLHVETVAVDGLARLGDASAREAVEQFRARLTQTPPPAGFELELHQEAAQAADRALALLSK
jgi:hypothetical protein